MTDDEKDMIDQRAKVAALKTVLTAVATTIEHANPGWKKSILKNFVDREDVIASIGPQSDAAHYARQKYIGEVEDILDDI